MPGVFSKKRKREAAAPRGKRSKAHRSSRRTSPSAIVNMQVGSVRLPKTLVPKQRKHVFNYVERFTLNPGAGTGITQAFSANSLYDPNRTGIGHQPLGFDQLVGVFYDHYMVTSATLTLTVMPRDTGEPSDNTLVAIIPRDTSTSITDIEEVIEQGDAVYGVVGGGVSGKNHLVLSHTISIAKFLGRAPWGDSQLKGSSSSNPAEEAFFQIVAAGLSGGGDPGTLDMLATIQYTTYLQEPKALPGS